MKPSTLRREWALMILPILLLVGVSWWGQNRPASPAPQPKPTPTHYRLEIAEFKVVPPTPYEVWRGVDTKVVVEVKTAGVFTDKITKFAVPQWLDSYRISAKKSGQIVYDSWIGNPTPRIYVGDGKGVSTSSGGDGQHSRELWFHLGEVPRELGELELKAHFALENDLAPVSGESNQQRAARIKKSGSLSIFSAPLVLRKAGQSIEKPVVSTDPMFDLQKLVAKPTEAQLRKGEFQIVWDAFYRGPLDADRGMLYSIEATWELVSAGGKPVGAHNSVTSFYMMGGERSGQLKSDIDVAADFARAGSGPFKLRGTISMSGAWPKIIEIPIS